MRLLWRGSVSGRIAAPDGWFLSCGWSGYVLLVPVICLLLKLNRGLFLLVKPSHQQSYISDSQSHKVDYALCTLMNIKMGWEFRRIPTGKHAKTHIVGGGAGEDSQRAGAGIHGRSSDKAHSQGRSGQPPGSHTRRAATNNRHRKRGGTVNRYHPVFNAQIAS